MMDIDIEALRLGAQNLGLGALALSFLAGLFFSFNPVALAAIPVSLAYVTKARAAKQVAIYAGLFIGGMVAMHVLLGLAAGFGGSGVQAFLGRYWGAVLGPWLILMGLLWPGWIKLPLPPLAIRARRATSWWGAMGLGAIFSIAICPVCTPALVVLLGVGAATGSPLWAGLLLLAFALGRAVPLAIGASAVGLLERLRGVDRHRRLFESIGGVALILAGVYLMNAYFFWVPELAG
jgi:cytochrome c-type biogenesis protein